MASELILHQSEVLVFMDALGLDHLPGVETARLVPQDLDQRRRLLLAGIESLAGKGVLTVQDETHILPRNLVDLFEFLNQPEVLVICQKDTPGLGRQTFLEYFRNGRCVEMTFPTDTSYRFSEIASAEDVILRLLEIFPLQSETLPSEGLEVAMSEFNRFLDVSAASANPGIAELIDQAVMVAELGRIGLLDAFHQPRFSGKLTLLQMNGAEAKDAQDFMCLQGPHTAWLFELNAADTRHILINPVTPQACSERFAESLRALLPRK